jgi:uncharacterized Zn finger protein (UPF0148 family)
MRKVRTFAAKLAHAKSGKGKIICPICNSEVKIIKLIRAKQNSKAKWAPRQEVVKLCKCNEKEILGINI